MGGRAERLGSIDLVRGLAMVVMALDHARDYFGDIRIDPLALDPLHPGLYLTRWVTHFCAPVFVLLAGTSAHLYGRTRSRGRLARFLVSRGLWLVLLEFTLVKFGWIFSFTHPFWLLQVIAAIGVGMVVLGGLVFLPRAVVLAVGLALVAGHNALDGVDPDALAWPGVFRVLHEGQAFIPLAGGQFLIVIYPLLPWTGVLALGYALGPVFDLPRERRRRLLIGAGLAASVLFVALRAANLYGEPDPWSAQPTALATVGSLLDCEKYPPSLQFLLMTLGPALVLLGLLERGREPGRLARGLIVYGRVPLFYYLLHLPLIHGLSCLVYLVQHGEALSPMRAAFRARFPEWFGNGLGAVYLGWVAVVALLWFPCAWYEGVKRRSRSPLLSYL